MNKRPTTPEKALERAAARCAAAEYCQADWTRRFTMQGFEPDVVARLVARLVEERFVDDRRYARAYVHDKSEYQRWGKQKILQGLLQKHISREIIDEALNSISDDENRERLLDVLRQKLRSLPASDEPRRKREKLLRFAASRGYELHAAIDALDALDLAGNGEGEDDV